MSLNGTQLAGVTGNFLQVSNITLISVATNWTSSNPSVVTVTTNGLVAAVGGGTATVRAMVNDVTGTSAPITIAVAALVLTQKPTNQTVVVADSATFSVAATGTSLSYQWSFNSTPISGATGATLTLTNVALAQSGTYTISVTNSGGGTNASAMLTVLQASLAHRYSFVSDASDSVGGANGSIVAPNGGGAATIAHGLFLPGNTVGGFGYSGYVSLTTGLLTNTASLTVECWVTQNQQNTWAEIWDFANSGAQNFGLIPYPANNGNNMEVAFTPNGGEIDLQSPLSFSNNSEQYVAVTFNSSSLVGSLYYNGTLLAATTFPNSSYTPGAIGGAGGTAQNMLGNDTYGDYQFSGTVYEFRIWDGAVSPLYIAVSAAAGSGVLVTNLTPSTLSVSVPTTNMVQGQSQSVAVIGNFPQASGVPVTGAATNWTSSNTNVLTVSSSGLITAVGTGSATISATLAGITGTSAAINVASFLPGSVTVAYWQFSDPTHLGFDSSGNSNTLTTATGTPTNIGSGMFPSALYLDGNSTMTTLSGNFPVGIPTNANAFTIAVWEKADAGCPNNGGFVGWGVNGTGEANDFRLNGPNSVDDYWYNNDFVVNGTTVNPMDGNWHALAVTWDGTNEIIYVDGANVGTHAPTPPNVQPTNFVVGKTTSDVNFKGWMADMLIADAALTPADIAVFQTGNWLPSLTVYALTPTASPSNIVYAGTAVTLSAWVAGSAPFQYQWQKNGMNISGGTAAALVLTNTFTNDSGNYDVIVSNSSGTNTSAALAVTVNPASPPIFVMQPTPALSTNYVGGLVTFTAAVNGTGPIQLQWQRNGTNILNANTSSLTLASLQTSETGAYTLVAFNSLGFTNSQPAMLTVLPPPNPSSLNVLTYHVDNTRQGANTNEVILTPNNVNVSTFGRLITYPTDGYIFAQPLYVSGVTIPGQGIHNIVFVATENDTVYAFDADSNAGDNGGLLWRTNLGTAVSSYTGEFGTRFQGTYYGDIVPVVGITGTPVIDPASGTLYVNVHTREVTPISTNYFHRIHALNITNGAEQPYSPAVVGATIRGTGVDSTNGVMRFSPISENQRPGMTLTGGMLYAAYGSYADTDPYHGWVIGFNATNLAFNTNYVFNTTPNATVADFGVNAGEGALWMGGNGLCADVSNNLFFATANGSFSANTNGGDYGDSFVKLSTTNGLAVADYFTPYNEAQLAANDTDLGSGGTILLPDSVGSVAHPHLMIGAGKAGTIYLVDRDTMGHFNAANDSQIVQELPGAFSGAWSTPTYFNNEIYYQGSGDVMRAFRITNGVINSTPVSVSGTSFSALGGTPVISANGTNNGIVWTLQSDGAGSSSAVVLHAYNATNLAQELYNSSQNFGRDNPGSAIKMTAPAVVNGKVFVPAQYAVSIFGTSLFLATPAITPAGGLFTNSITVTLTDATPNSGVYYTVDGTLPTTNSLIYSGPFVLTTSAQVQAVATQPGAVNSGVASAAFVNSSAVGSGAGLQGSYWSNVTAAAFTNVTFSAPPTLIRTDSVINFDWTGTPPDPSIGLTNFIVRWLGSIQPEYSELYTFTTLTKDGVRLYVNGQLVINAWTNQPATAWSNSIPLKAQQRYNIEMDFFNQSGGAQAALYWSSPSTTNTIILQSQLYPVTNPPPSVAVTAPLNGATYTASAGVTISADADAPFNPISAVSLYANSMFLGSVSNVPYTLTTTGLAAGTYSLTAVATDGSGLSNTSAVVNITVNPGTGQPYGLSNNTAAPAFFNMPTTFAGGIPATLSMTGVFSNTPAMGPTSGLIPYSPNTPLWSDGAVKTRYIAVPNNGGAITSDEQIGFSPTNYWSFPAGTVFVKTFQLNTDTSNPSALRRLETRLLIRDINGAVYGVTYKWRPDNSDADLLTNSLTENISITNGTSVSTQTWYYPSPSDCLRCHTSVANYVLGVNARQLNGNFTYLPTGVTDNQLRTLNRLGMFNPAFDEAAIATFPQLSSVTNLSASLEQRSRSYLDANCAQCHQPGGTGITFDARYITPLANQNITNYPAAFNLGFDNSCIIKSQDVWRSSIWQRINTTNNTIQMPPLARNVIDSNAVAVLTAWINSLPGTPAEVPPTITPNGGSYFNGVSVTLSAPDTNALIRYTLDGSLPTANSPLYSGPFNLTASETVTASAWRTNYNNSVATSAPFFVAPLQFTPEGFATNRQFQLNFLGVPGSNYVLEATTNFENWTPLSTSTATTNSVILFDPAATNFSFRFYRVRQQ